MSESEQAWHPFLGGLRAFVARRVPAGEADDVTQDVLLRLHSAAQTLREEHRAEAWVYGIARRTIADFYRTREAAGDKVCADDEADPDVEAPENLATFDGEHSVHEEVLSWLRPLVEDLPDADRQALVMADFEGRTQQEVADALGLSLSGAKSRVQRARVKLGEALRACCAVEFGPDARARAFRRI